MKTLTTTLAIAILVVAGAADAGDNGHGKKLGHKKHDYAPRHDLYDYASVIDSRPIYREVRVSTPQRECSEQPVYHTRHGGHRSAGGMLAGGLLGGIIGHQFGKGRGNRVATAMGTLIGAQIGHQAVNGDDSGHGGYVAGYEQHCEVVDRVRYESVIDGYDVTYRYRGKQYRIEMPYDPGPRIKMRIQFTPVI